MSASTKRRGLALVAATLLATFLAPTGVAQAQEACTVNGVPGARGTNGPDLIICGVVDGSTLVDGRGGNDIISVGAIQGGGGTFGGIVVGGAGDDFIVVTDPGGGVIQDRSGDDTIVTGPAVGARSARSTARQATTVASP